MKDNEKMIIGYIKDLQMNALNTLKDEEFQRRVWFRLEGPEVSSYTSCTIHYISRCERLFENESCREFLGKENLSFLKKLYDLIRKHLNKSENKLGDADLLEEDEILNDPQWHDIQTLAGEVDVKLTELVRSKEDDPK